MADDESPTLFPNFRQNGMIELVDKRIRIAQFIVEYLYKKCDGASSHNDEIPVLFSVLELQEEYGRLLFSDNKGCTFDDIQDALLYLSKIGAMNLEGGFLVLYNGLSIKRLVMDNKIRYKKEDYKQLDEFYRNRIQQIHIVGEYANMMVRNYDDALQFVNDYFQMEYRYFIAKYFKGNRSEEINRNITSEKYDMLFGCLSKTQTSIIQDETSNHIAVIAGPGSGKTRVLVHKLASLLILEDVKSEQLLMLTFSRSAATEFKQRLIDLIGPSAVHYVEIKTFHSYCFDLLGKIGNLDESNNIVRQAADMIESGEVELGQITKTVLVIDEAQDMNEDEFALVKALMQRNDGMRIIAVGDDDQNIYEFRGSDSLHMKKLITDYDDAKRYEMLENYRSDKSIVSFSNAFAHTIHHRMKNADIVSIPNNMGRVELTKHCRTCIETAVVNHLKNNWHGEKTCILTWSNAEAFRVMGVLTENNIQAKLIQSNEGFNLYNLVELRYFIKEISEKEDTPIVDDSDWEAAVKNLKKEYASSFCLPLVIKLITTFASINEKKYRSDFIEYACESNLEDFYENNSASIVVSTIHKAKGCEFDSVYMLLSESVNFTDDRTKRAVYVGMTRAKHELYVHYIDGFLDQFKNNCTEHIIDDVKYSEPPRIMLQLSHKDVFLNYSIGKKKAILESLKSGAKLRYDGNYFYARINGSEKPVCCLSKKATDAIRGLEAKGYSVMQAEIRYIVAWHPKDDPTKDHALVLPNIHLEKKL